MLNTVAGCNIKFVVGVEVSYLDTKLQILLNDVIEYNCCDVSAKWGTQKTGTLAFLYGQL